MANNGIGVALVGIGALSWLGSFTFGGLFSGTWGFIISAGLIVLGLSQLRRR